MDERFKEPYSHPRWWYEGKSNPLCFNCTHFRGAKKGKIRCEAFPEQIPVDLFKKSKENDLNETCNGTIGFVPVAP